MAVTGTCVQATGGNLWVANVASDLPTPTFYVWMNDRFLFSTTRTYFKFEVPWNETGTISIFDSSTDIPGDIDTRKAYIDWEGVDTAEQYSIYDVTGGAETCLGIVAEHLEWMHEFATPALTDCTSHSIEIRTRDRSGYEGEALQVDDIYVVGEPDYEASTYSFSNTTHMITVTA